VVRCSGDGVAHLKASRRRRLEDAWLLARRAPEQTQGLAYDLLFSSPGQKVADLARKAQRMRSASRPEITEDEVGDTLSAISMSRYASEVVASARAA
jgi:hypothetical protein